MSFQPGQGPDFSSIAAGYAATQTPAGTNSQGVPGDLATELAEIGVTSLAGLSQAQLAEIATRLTDHRNQKAAAAAAAQAGQTPANGAPPPGQAQAPGQEPAPRGQFETVNPRGGFQDGSNEGNLTAGELGAIQGQSGPVDFLGYTQGVKNQYAGSQQYLAMLYDRLRILSNAYAQQTGGNAGTIQNPNLLAAITETERELYRTWRAGGLGELNAPFDPGAQTIALGTEIKQGDFDRFLAGQGIYLNNPAVKSALEAANPNARPASPEPTQADVSKLQGYIQNLSGLKTRTPDQQSQLDTYKQRLADYQARVAAVAAQPQFAPAPQVAPYDTANYGQGLPASAGGQQATPTQPGGVDYGAAAAKNLQYIQNLQAAAQQGPLSSQQLNSLAAATAKYQTYTQQAQQAPAAPTIQQPAQTSVQQQAYSAPTQYQPVSAIQPISQPAPAPVDYSTQIASLDRYISNLSAVTNPTADQQAKLATYTARRDEYAAR